MCRSLVRWITEQLQLRLLAQVVFWFGGRASAESILTLKNRESIHFDHFCDRLCEKNRFMIHEPIHVLIHVSFLLCNETWHFMYCDTRFADFKNRLSTSLDMSQN